MLFAIIQNHTHYYVNRHTSKGLRRIRRRYQMENTVHATILNRNDKKNIPDKQAADNILLTKAISPLRQKAKHDWVGSLEKVGQASQ